MKLTVYFYDRKGVSLASPEHLAATPEGYAAAWTMRDNIAAARGVPVYLQIVEEP